MQLAVTAHIIRPSAYGSAVAGALCSIKHEWEPTAGLISPQSRVRALSCRFAFSHWQLSRLLPSHEGYYKSPGSGCWVARCTLGNPGNVANRHPEGPMYFGVCVVPWKVCFRHLGLAPAKRRRQRAGFVVCLELRCPELACSCGDSQSLVRQWSEVNTADGVHHQAMVRF